MVFLLKNYISKKKHHVRGGSILCCGCMLPPSRKLVGPTNYERISRERPCDSIMRCFVRIIFHLTLHLNFFTYFGL